MFFKGCMGVGLILASQIVCNISSEAKYSIPQSIITVFAMSFGISKLG